MRNLSTFLVIFDFSFDQETKNFNIIKIIFICVFNRTNRKQEISKVVQIIISIVSTYSIYKEIFCKSVS